MLIFLLSTNRRWLLWLLFATSIMSNNSLADKSTSSELPLKVFYQGALLDDIKLSPDGTHLLALKNTAEVTTLMVMEIATGKTFYPVKTDNKKFKFNWVVWGNNDRLLLSLRFSKKNGKQAYDLSRLLSVDAKYPSELVGLTPRKYSESISFPSQFQDKIISMLPDDPEHILMSFDTELWAHDTVYKVNIYSGKMTLHKKYSGSINSWLADGNGVIRVGMGYSDEDQKQTIKVLDLKKNKWVTAWEYIELDEPGITPVGFGKNPNELYLFADYQGRQALYKADLSKEGFPKELIVSDTARDIQGQLIYSPAHKDVVGVYYNDGSHKSIYWNKEFKAFQAGLDKAMPDTSNFIIGMSDDARKYLLYVTNAVTPGSIFHGNRDTKELSLLAELHPQLALGVLTKKQSLIYKARDGLELEGFLSLPKNFANTPIATIILPHGGPFSEDGIGYDDFSAFMANRGYAVFQPNFRGSTGYGHNFMKMAVSGMGLAMQDDLEDAVKFLVEKKITDPKKVCIVGGSYGGYAALMGVTKTPDLYQCAISFAGISDIKKLRAGYRYSFSEKLVKRQLGSDFEQLKQTSPAYLAERVKVPILLIHGTKDTRVPIEQSDLMAKRLRSAGKTFEYIKLEDGSHFLDYLPHRKQTFEAMDAFLKKYLPL